MSLQTLSVLPACSNYGKAICYFVIASVAEAFLLCSCDNDFSVILEYKYCILLPALNLLSLFVIKYGLFEIDPFYPNLFIFDDNKFAYGHISRKKVQAFGRESL